MPVKRKAAEAFSKGTTARVEVKKSAAQHVSAFAAARARSAAAEIKSDIPNGAGLTDAESQEAAQLVHQPASLEVESQNVVQDEQRMRQLRASPRTTTPTSTVALFSSPGIRVHDLPNGTLEMLLPQSSYATLLGEYDIEVQSGSVSLYGATFHLKSGRQRVYAHSTHAIPQITATSADTVLHIMSIQRQSCKLAELSPLFRNISVPEAERSFILLDDTTQDTLQRLPSMLDTPRQYQTLLTRLAMKWESGNRQLSIACIGGKSSGKSTFARHLCNKLLTRTSTRSCYHLDLDPGQPEFGPPGQLYLVEVKSPLLGPSYTHLASKQTATYNLVAAHSVAATTFRDSPQHYLDCVRTLFAHKRLVAARAAGCPLIVNTCGWVNDLGARVLTDILDNGITDAVILDTVDNVVTKAATDKCQEMHELARPVGRPSPRTPAELRQMQTMAYFHSRQTSADTNALSWSDKPISSWRPWMVSYADNAGGIKVVASYGQPVGAAFLAEVLDGSLVAIVTTEEAFEQQDILRTPHDLPYLRANRQLDPRYSECLGVALIRSVDAEERQLQLLTPLDDASIGQLMQKTVILVRGSFDSPDWAYLEDIYQSGVTTSTTQRPWVAQREATGIESAVWRLRHPPTAPRHGRG